MILTHGNMQIFFKGVNFAFKGGFEMAPKEYLEFTTEFPSTTAIEQYPFNELFGGMKEWIGERQIGSLSAKFMEVANRDFEDTIGVKRTHLEDDKIGIYMPMAKQIGQTAGMLWPELAIEALANNGKWLDNSAFFVTTRKYGENTICNKTTDQLSYESYQAARLTMRKYKGHNDKPLKSNPNLLVVGPALEEKGKEILEFTNRVKSFEADTDDETLVNHVAVPNVAKGTAKLSVNLDLVGEYENFWYLMNTTGVIKPVGLQIRKKPKGLEELENSKLKKDVIYGCDARGAGFLTFPHLAYAGIVPA